MVVQPKVILGSRNEHEVELRPLSKEGFTVKMESDVKEFWVILRLSPARREITSQEGCLAQETRAAASLPITFVKSSPALRKQENGLPAKTHEFDNSSHLQWIWTRRFLNKNDWVLEHSRKFLINTTDNTSVLHLNSLSQGVVIIISISILSSDMGMDFQRRAWVSLFKDSSRFTEATSRL